MMVFCQVVFAGIVGAIEDSFAPKVNKLSLCVAAFEPVESLIV